jgi:hypothetical protein
MGLSSTIAAGPRQRSNHRVRVPRNLETYCNADNKPLLGNYTVTQQWKRSDRCYAMAQYTRVNNGGEDVFCVFGAVVISRVWSQFQQESDNWEVGQFSTGQYEARREVNAVN